MTPVTISAHPRIHMTLISMHHNGYRINGGLGFAIDRPQAEIRVQVSPIIKLIDMREFPFSVEASQRLINTLNIVQKQYALANGIEVTVVGGPLTHYGFGTGTRIRLACIEALFLVNGYAYTKYDLQRISGRGGTSGVGVYTYFTGGLVFDAGHPNRAQSLVPSSVAEGRGSFPLLLRSVEMPGWDIGLCIPTNIGTVNAEAEYNHFTRTCPISLESAMSVLHHCAFGILPAAMENDLDTFAKAVREIQNGEWKLAERRLHGSQLEKLEHALYQAGALAVGMSSIGPTLYFFATDVLSVVAKLEELRLPCRLLVTKPANEGRIVTIN